MILWSYDYVIIINIFEKLSQYQNLDNYVFEDKIVIIKENWLIIQNII